MPRRRSGLAMTLVGVISIIVNYIVLAQDADYALLSSKYCADRFMDLWQVDYYSSFVQPAEEMLQELGLSTHYQIISDPDIEQGRLQGYEVLILPNAVELSRLEIQRIDDFVEAGGLLFITANTSRWDRGAADWHTGFGLESVGVIFEAVITGYVWNMDIQEPDSSLVDGTFFRPREPDDDKDIVLNGGQAFTVVSLKKGTSAVTRWTNVQGSTTPIGLTVNSYGEGIVVYCSGEFFKGWKYTAHDVPDWADPNSEPCENAERILKNALDARQLMPFLVFTVTLDKGPNIVSLPLKPSGDYFARHLAEDVGATVVYRIREGNFDAPFIAGHTPGDGFPILGGRGYIVYLPADTSVTFTGAAWSEDSEPQPAPIIASDVTWAWAVGGIVSSSGNDAPGSDRLLVQVRNTQTNESVECWTRHVEPSCFTVAFGNMNCRSVARAGDIFEVTVRDVDGHLVAGPIPQQIEVGHIERGYLLFRIQRGDIRVQNELGQNFPNPFNPETWIPYQVSNDTPVEIMIHNLAGQVVRRLSLGVRTPGSYTHPARAAYWDGRSDTGEQLPSGVYFYQLRAGSLSAVRKAVLLK